MFVPGFLTLSFRLSSDIPYQCSACHHIFVPRAFFSNLFDQCNVYSDEIPECGKA